MKVIIAGSRDFTNYETLVQVIEASPFHITEVVSGAARGVDTLGERWATERGIPIKRFPADWERHGKAAGVIRNSEMAAYADGLIALWDGRSRGTKDMINKAAARNLRSYVQVKQP